MFMHARQFEEYAFDGPYRTVASCEVRSRSIHTGADKRNRGRIIAPDSVYTANCGLLDLGNDIGLLGARANNFCDPLVHCCHNLARVSHILDLTWRLNNPLPFHEARRVLELRPRCFKRLESDKRQVVAAFSMPIVADPRPCPAMISARTVMG